ncbi:hypothetical protein DSO57_1022970 [Entomophthora muscae]|uniref:Uncharacterized protein n=1 Tax=Entomophthora muscae TaxID=34485 RepID=A0ACC2TQJ5_9FUNG|nr:hypothetical protein DSO57_1022970 [Entomophthora muscae]
MKEKMTGQNLPTFAHVLNQATSQETWKTYFCAHNINKDIPSACTVFKGLKFPKHAQDNSIQLLSSTTNKRITTARNIDSSNPDNSNNNKESQSSLGGISSPPEKGPYLSPRNESLVFSMLKT